MSGRHIFKLSFDISWPLDTAGVDQNRSNTLCFVYLKFRSITPMKLDFRNQRNLVNKNVILQLSVEGEYKLLTKNLVTWTKATDFRELILNGKKYTFTVANLPYQLS